MYRGKRDAYVSIKVPMELCFETEFPSGIWIEIMIPPLDFKTNTEPWNSFVVKPEQVFWLDESNNLIEGLNAHARIRCCKHYNDENGRRRTIPNTDITLDQYDIVRLIEHYVYEKNK